MLLFGSFVGSFCCLCNSCSWICLSCSCCWAYCMVWTWSVSPVCCCTCRLLEFVESLWYWVVLASCSCCCVASICFAASCIVVAICSSASYCSSWLVPMPLGTAVVLYGLIPAFYALLASPHNIVSSEGTKWNEPDKLNNQVALGLFAKAVVKTTNKTINKKTIITSTRKELDHNNNNNNRKTTQMTHEKQDANDSASQSRPNGWSYKRPSNAKKGIWVSLPGKGYYRISSLLLHKGGICQAISTFFFIIILKD